MPRRDFMKSATKFARELDDMAKITTGRRLMELGALFMTMMRGVPPVNTDDPYYILGIQRNCTDRVVKAAFRALAFEYHPDTGLHPDVKKFQKVKEAYDQVVKERDSLKNQPK